MHSRTRSSGFGGCKYLGLIAGTTAVALTGYYMWPKGIDKEFLGGHKMINWTVPDRKKAINKLKNSKRSPYDLLIIGGGATGSGIALEAVSRGLNVALVERGDFVSETSSKSTKLIHGGVRYLEKAFMELDREQYNLVCEALSERHTFLKVAPHLTNELPIILPIYNWSVFPKYWIGSKFYDLFSGIRALSFSYMLTANSTIKKFPTIKKNNLVGSVVYYDGQQDDTRTSISLILTSMFYGATALNYAEVTGLIKEKQVTKGGKSRVCGAVVLDHPTGDKFEVYAKGVINATGPFVDSIRTMDDAKAVPIVAPSSGVHITLDKELMPEDFGLIDPKTDDGRVIFMLPWKGSVIAGTTDTATNVSRNPIPSKDDIMYILKELSKQLSPDIKLSIEDVKSAWSGLRPLVRDPSAKNKSSQALVRNHLIHISDTGLLTISGGKWTTYRAMGEETVDKAIKEYGLKPIRKSCTEELLLIGAHHLKPSTIYNVSKALGGDSEVARHLVSSYGDRSEKVTSIANAEPTLRDRIIAKYPVIKAEIIYVINNEMALNAVDFIARRTRLAFLDTHETADALPSIVDVMSKELNWDHKTMTKQYHKAMKYLESMGYKVLPRKSMLPKILDENITKEFNQKTTNGSVTYNQFIDILRKTNVTYDRQCLQNAEKTAGMTYVKNGDIDLNMVKRVVEKLHCC